MVVLAERRLPRVHSFWRESEPYAVLTPRGNISSWCSPVHADGTTTTMARLCASVIQRQDARFCRIESKRRVWPHPRP